MKRIILLFSLLCFLVGCSPGIPDVEGNAYYLDCQNGNDNHNGTTPNRAWKTLSKINSTIFQPGDGIFIRRGTKCQGVLSPKGSGTQNQPIILGAYGTGELPIIDAGKNEAALKLIDQEYWHIQDIETSGGVDYGVLVTSTNQGNTLHHFRLSNLVVHDVIGEPPESKTFGLIIFLPAEGIGNRFEDIVLDGVTAYHTNQWAGISILGSNHWPIDAENPGFGSDIVVRNSIVHDTWGDGITLFYVKNGLIEHSIAYDTGQQPPPQTIGTPSSIWTWMCHDCIVQYNESYQAKTPEVDGGCFDIDWGTKNNVYQYNYGHDCDGYCFSYFGAEGYTSENAIIRYNICANNGQDSSLALRQGDIYISTWENGSLNGVKIHNNTFYWNPIRNAPLIVNRGKFVGENPNIFANNIIYSVVPWLVDSDRSLTFDHNLYWYQGEKQPVWYYGMKAYTNLEQFQQGSGQEAHGMFQNPLLLNPTYHEPGIPEEAFLLQAESPAIDSGMDLGEMGEVDFWGNPIPARKTYDIGAHEYQGKTSMGNFCLDLPDIKSLLVEELPLGEMRGKYFLFVFLNLLQAVKPGAENLSRNQLVILRSLFEKFSSKKLKIILFDTSGYLTDSSELENAVYSLNIRSFQLMRNNHYLQKCDSPVLVLVNQQGKLVKSWQGLVSSHELDQQIKMLFSNP